LRIFALFFISLFLGLHSAFAFESGRYQGPIIDMHLHAQVDVGQKRQFCFPQPCVGALTQSDNAADVREGTLRAMIENNIVLGIVSDYPENVFHWVEGEEDRFWVGILYPSEIPIDELEGYFTSGRARVMGEMGEQYKGIAADDPVLDPIFALAHKYDIPILIHLAGFGGSEDFPSHLGNPLRLVPVLQKYPGLRIYLENAGFPFLEEVTALMYQYPSVYVDVSTILHLIPRDTAQRYIKGLVDNGLEKRIMFGSDQMIWPEVINEAIETIQTADFLTQEQKADIFYNNAAGFLRLSEEEISKHHMGKNN